MNLYTKIVTTFWLGFASWFVLNSECRAEDPPGHYFLVIDHSGSMLSKIKTGKDRDRTRWEAMRERSASFVERLPQGSHIWAGVFSSPKTGGQDWISAFSSRITDDTARAAMVAKLKAYPEPALENGTWLRQATAEALDRAATVAAQNPDAFMTVMVYTDGVDQGTGRFAAQMAKNPGSKITVDELSQKVTDLKNRCRNFQLVNIYEPGDESILDVHVIRLRQNRFVLYNPLAKPKQEIDLALLFRNQAGVNLDGLPLGLKLVAPQESAVSPLHLTGSGWKLQNEPVKVAIEKKGSWPENRDVRAQIKLSYPVMQDAMIVAEGGDVVDLFIPGAKTPAIENLLPSSGSSFPVGRDITFSMTTSPGVEIEWNFADGSSGNQNPTKHNYKEPGKKIVTVKVKDTQTNLQTVATTEVQIVDLKLSIDPLPLDAIPEKPVTLTASASGEFRSYEWDINGRTFVGQPRKDGMNGSQIVFTPDRPGEWQVHCRGLGSVGGIAEAIAAKWTVKEVPALRLTSPAPGEILYFESVRELRAEVEGANCQQLRFFLKDGAQDLIEPQQVDVRREGSIRVAVYPVKIPRLKQKAKATVIVETIDSEPLLRREVQVLLESAPASMEIDLPEGRSPHINRDTLVELSSNAELTRVQWNFGAGWIDGNSVMRHAWNRYGKYTIQAKAIAPDGTEIIATPVDIDIPIRPVKLDVAVIYKGKSIGTEIAKVPVNATLELRKKVEGDATATRWMVDGMVLQKDQDTIVVTERGVKTVALVADGTPEVGGENCATSPLIEFRTNDKILFWSGVAAIIAGLSIAARLLLGNKWRFAELHVAQKHNGVSFSNGNPKTGPLKIPWGIKSWWTKRTEITMAALDQKTCITWKPDDRLAFIGRKDPSLSMLGQRKENVALAPRSQDERPAGVIKQWQFRRVPLLPAHEHRIGTISLKLKAFKPGIVGRWPEALLICFVAVTIATLRLLFELLY